MCFVYSDKIPFSILSKKIRGFDPIGSNCSMNSGKLGSLLNLLDERARTRMLEFLQSPYFNQSASILKLYRYWYQCQQAGLTPLDEQALFEEVFPEESYTAIKLKNQKAALQRKLDAFFAQEVFQNDPGQRALALLQYLNLKNEDKYFPFYVERAANQFQTLGLERTQLELLNYQLEDAMLDFSFRQATRSEDMASAKTYLHAQSFFYLETLKYLVRQENSGAILGGLPETTQATKMLAMFSEADDLPEGALYRLLLHVFQAPQDRLAFDALQQALINLGGQVSEADAREVFTGALNHCIRQINRGEGSFLNEMLALYKEMDVLNLLQINALLPAAQFKNMVSLGLRCGDFGWVQAMIDKYGSLVADDAQGNAAVFNQGILFFFQGNFDAAEKYLNKVLESYDDVFYGLDARAYLLRVHYETGNILGMESLAESFKMFLKRNKRIPKAHKASYLTATRFFRRLIKIPDYDKPRLAALAKEIEASGFAGGSKRWLLAKIESLLA